MTDKTNLISSTDKAYQELETIFGQFTHLDNITSLLQWDTRVNLPLGSGASRSLQLAAINQVMNQLLCDKRVKVLLDQVNEATLDSVEKRNFELMRKMGEESTIYPPSLLARLSEVSVRCEHKWVQAKLNNDFKMVEADLAEVYHLSREKAHIRGRWLKVSPYDAMLDIYSPGLDAKYIDNLFRDLPSKALVYISKFESGKPKSDISATDRQFESIIHKLLDCLGFNFYNGRVDKSSHPFCSGSTDDIRLTSSFDGANLMQSILDMMHETGHGLYEQGLDRRLETKLVGKSAGMAIHESCSLFYDFFISRNPHVMNYLQKMLVESGISITISELKNRLLFVDTKELRMHSGPVCYPLHILLRYELEKQLFAEAEFDIKHLPELWSEKQSKILGYKPESDKQGVLQDIHWYGGMFGYFPSYGIGMLLAAQYYSKVSSFIKTDVRNGLKDVKQWMTNNVYTLCSKYPFQAFVNKATCSDLSTKHYYNFLDDTYSMR